jgi:Holliday junction resolvase-like predicted endonuclease
MSGVYLWLHERPLELFKLAADTPLKVLDLSAPLPLKAVMELMDRVRAACREAGVKEALRVKGFLTVHEVLRICAEEKLKKLGYRVVSRDEAPEFIRRVGSPDIVAEKNGSWVLVEVKTLDQLARYEEAGAKLILVTNVKRGKDVVIWGVEELES